MSDDLKLKIDSSQARADLAALAKSLDSTTAAYNKMQAGISKGASATDAALAKSAKNMESFAKIAGTISKVKLSGDPAKAVTEFANALNALARVKEIRPQTLANFSKFLQVGYQAQKLQFGANAFGGIQQFATAMNSIAAVRSISSAKMKSYVDFIEIAARASRLRMDGGASRNLEMFGRAMDSIARTRGISPQRLAGLKELFNILSTAKGFPNANGIARDLDHIAASAARAGAALNAMPTRARGLSAGLGVINRDLTQHHKLLDETPRRADRATRGFSMLGASVGSLTGRFNLAYQAGTLFSAMFSAFTFGQFVKGIYDASIQMQKLEKALFFTTGTFAGAKDAAKEYLAISDQLGMRALANADAYSRFAISSAAIGATQKEVNAIFKSTGQALTSVGASTQQWEYAFYGLSQAMAKGKITSEEFNRQIGEQIPGNVAAGVKALSALRGRSLSASEFFDEMKKGAIESLPFLKLWAVEIEAMFGDLVKIAEKRPDFQLNRLMNAFDLFKVQVGNAGFIGELTNQFRSLANVFVKTTEEGGGLTATGEKLAKSMGLGLASVVRGLGDGIKFLVDHLDELIIALKGIAALGLAHVFSGWSAKAMTFAGSMLTTAKASFAAAAGIRTVEAAADGATASGVVNAAAGGLGNGRTRAGGRGPVDTGLPAVAALRGQSYESIRRQGHSHNDALFYGASAMKGREDFWKRDDVSSRGAAPVATFGRRVSSSSINGTIDMTRGAKGAGIGGLLNAAGAGAAAALTPFKALGAILPGIGTLIMGATIALVAFGNSLTGFKSAAGNAITYNDIVKGMLDDSMKSVAGWTKTVTGGFIDMEKSGFKAGNVVALVAASLKTLVGGIITLATTLGKVIGTVVATSLTLIGSMGMMIDRAIHLDAKGVKAIAEAVPGAIGDMWKGLGKELKEDFKVFDAAGNYRDVMAGAGASADARAAKDAAALAASEQASAADKALEASQQQKMAADAQLRASADMTEATAMFREKTKPLSYGGDGGLREQIVALMNGTYKATTSASTTSAGRPTTHTYDAVKAAAAPAAGSINERLLATASSREGQKEAVAAQRQSLMAFFAVAGQPVDPKITAWCAAFVNAVLASNGLQGTGALNARSFLNYGEETKDPTKGDIVVLRRGNDEKKGHVGFFDGFDDKGNVRVLGGNQGNAVSTASFKASDVLSYRRAGSGAPLGASAAATAAAGGAGVAVTEDKAESMFEKRANAWKSLQPLLGAGSPAEGAIADFQSNLERMRDVIRVEQELADRVGGSFKSFFDATVLDRLDRSVKKWTTDLQDSLNPLSKEVRLATMANDVNAMRVKGMSEEADWQERLNDLREQGYDVDLMQDESKWLQYLNGLKESGLDIDIEAMKMSPEQWTASRRRADGLQAELDLTKALNDARVESIGRTGSAYDATLAGLVSGRAKPGESLSQAQDRMGASGELDTLMQQAGVIEGGRRDGVMFSQRGRVQETLATRNMNGSQMSRRANYRDALKEVTGSQSEYLGDIEKAATDADKAWAKYVADVQYAADNPPGFQKWVNGLQPLAERLQDIKAEFAEDLSSSITDALMGDKVDWSKMVDDMRRKMIKAQVDTIMGGLFNVAKGNDAQGAPSDKGFLGRLGSIFTGGEAAVAQDPAVAAQTGAANQLTTAGMSLTGAAQALTAAAGALSMGGGAGVMAGAPAAANDWFGSLASGSDDMISSWLGGGSSAASSGAGGWYDSLASGSDDMIGSWMGGAGKASGGMMGKIAGIGMNLLPHVLGLFGGKDKAQKERTFSPVNGVIGESSTNNVDATQVAAHANPIGSLLSAVVSMVGSAWGTPGGMFKEGGITGSAVSSVVMHPSTWANAPHYAQGTPNTSGGMPAIVHPDEAIIPLSRGRKVPVEMKGAGGGQTILNSTFIVNTPDAGSFRESQGALQRKQNRNMRRAQARNGI